MLTTTRRRVLLAAAAWTTYVWGTRLFLLWGGDESTGFKVVHTVLAVVSLAFAAAIARIALTTTTTPGFSSEFSPSDGENSLENGGAP